MAPRRLFVLGVLIDSMERIWNCPLSGHRPNFTRLLGDELGVTPFGRQLNCSNYADGFHFAPLKHGSGGASANFRVDPKVLDHEEQFSVSICLSDTPCNFEHVMNALLIHDLHDFGVSQLGFGVVLEIAEAVVFIPWVNREKVLNHQSSPSFWL